MSAEESITISSLNEEGLYFYIVLSFIVVVNVFLYFFSDSTAKCLLNPSVSGVFYLAEGPRLILHLQEYCHLLMSCSGF